VWNEAVIPTEPNPEVVMMVIQAMTPNGYFQHVHQMADRGYLTVTNCYSILDVFKQVHPDWYFVYTGCFY
jgi:hypothetical protein